MTHGGHHPDRRRGVFVRRTPEFALVSRALEAARSGRPTIVVIEGEAGICKTAFLRRCTGHLDDAVVLEASRDELEVTLDFGVVDQLVARGSCDGVGAAGRRRERHFVRRRSGPLGMFGVLQDVETVLSLDAGSMRRRLARCYSRSGYCTATVCTADRHRPGPLDRDPIRLVAVAERRRARRAGHAHGCATAR